jgi:hypothetical protein
MTKIMKPINLISTSQRHQPDLSITDYADQKEKSAKIYEICGSL